MIRTKTEVSNTTYQQVNGTALNLSKKMNANREQKTHIAFEKLVISILIVVSIYTLALIPLMNVVEYFGVSTFVDIGLLLIFTFAIFVFIKKSGYPMAAFGLTFENWRENVKEAIVFTSPILIFFFLIKWGLITFIPTYSEISLLNPAAAFAEINFTFTTFILTVIIYIVFSFVQEFIARGGLQSAFNLFLTEGKGRTVKAILLSNLLFAVAHTHIGTVFALAAFIPGLFWGWLYARQNSIIGVSVSHILVGIWVIFILGFPEFLN